jgi:transcriptional regulator of heat shock response
MNTTSAATAVAEPSPGPAPETKTKSPGSLNQAQARALTKAENIGLAAQNEDHAPALAAREITADFTTQFLADVDGAREQATSVLVSTTARQTASAAERVASKSLLGGLREVQKAAKQKYARTNRIFLRDYFIGKKLNGSRPNLMQTSQTLLDKASGETLPGITTAKVKALRTARQTWVDAHTAKTANQSTALTQRVELKDMLKSIEDRKQAIQLAADAEWPHTDEANAGIRTQFALPAKRPLIA